MHYDIVELPARTVVGPTIRLSNGSPDEGSAIGQLWQRFMEEGMNRAIPDVQVAPYGCFGLYFDYDLNEMSYEMLIGCETDGAAPEGMRAQAIPAGRYAKFAIRGGDCVKSVQDVWEAVWADEELTAKRAFTGDFEAYLPGEDMSCADIDIFVALR
ncbi:GyrI-like domain-containing protein [Eggerthella sinensis]|uniref:AraC family transcriptional regulator n=1 Tax=Eggerthella sinensis TaxID=242230 RepID=A0A3N0IYB3_9ACTN|nr:GyrI-like domain-containing protein [Eggerthella sinensis]RDB65988.1 AraC family transcriptional regulator [Eggerthella sinensis]RNM41951.1 AraC family transcriptional regulator [Eggerthella sinensis]